MNHPLPYRPDIQPRLYGADGFTVEKWNQVLYYDPRPLLTRIQPLINPYARHQNLFMAQVWPNKHGICACGCGETLVGRKRRWAHPDHTWSSLQIFRIIQGDVDVIYDYIRRYHGETCAVCDVTPDKIDRDTQLFDLDHIIPVAHGGGGCWLSNYQLLCLGCHRIKTNRDFGWKQSMPEIQIGLFGE